MTCLFAAKQTPITTAKQSYFHPESAKRFDALCEPQLFLRAAITQFLPEKSRTGARPSGEHSRGAVCWRL